MASAGLIYTALNSKKIRRSVLPNDLGVRQKLVHNKEHSVPGTGTDAGRGSVASTLPTAACQKSAQVPNLISTTLLDGGSGSRAASTTKTTPLAACHLSTPTKRTSP